MCQGSLAKGEDGPEEEEQGMRNSKWGSGEGESGLRWGDPGAVTWDPSLCAGHGGGPGDLQLPALAQHTWTSTPDPAHLDQHTWTRTPGPAHLCTALEPRVFRILDLDPADAQQIQVWEGGVPLWGSDVGVQMQHQHWGAPALLPSVNRSHSAPFPVPFPVSFHVPFLVSFPVPLPAAPRCGCAECWWQQGRWHPSQQCLGMAELSGRDARCARGDSPVPGEEKHSWAQLLGSRPSLGHWSSSSSICTEDFAARFWEGMVEPLLCQQEPAGDVPTEGACPGQDESLFSRERSLNTWPQLVMEVDRHPWQDRSPSQSRRESLESLGARISRLSQSHVGVTRGVPWASPSAQPALGCRDSPCEDLVAMALPGHSWRTPGICAGRSWAGTSIGSSFPRASRARTRGHPAPRMRQQEPPALWGRGGNVTFAVDDTDREGADSSRSESGLALGHWEVLAQLWEPPGDGGPLCPQGCVETRKGGCHARTGLALLGHTWDTHHRCHTDLQNMEACVGQEQLDKEMRKPATSLEEKLELLQRLRELERGSRSLLQQRLRVMQRLQGLLQRDRAETLRQLQEVLEQVRRGGGDGRDERGGIGQAGELGGSISRAARGIRRCRGGPGAPRPWGPPRLPRGDTAPAPAVPWDRAPRRQLSAALSTSCGGSGSKSSGASGSGRGWREPWEPLGRGRR
ncbi:uncharacterized protein LOC134050873 [Cinclus cinclus]|uniref:uncharacterized protein LOC134050873 n=1 Tax=Cinclus cinclus TaxID=127875 RepID=UPI002E1140AB